MAALRRRARLIAALALMAGTTAVGAWLIAGPPAPAGTSALTSRTTIPVVRTTLVATEPVMARVTPVGQWTITAAAGTTADQVAAAVAAADGAAGELADARAALAAAQRVRDLTLAGDRVAVTAAPDATSRGAARRQLALDGATQGLAVVEASSVVTQATSRARTASADLGSARARACSCGSTVTVLPAIGSDVDRNGILYAVDGRPTVLLVGDTPAYRALRVGDRGTDVWELQQNLVALGHSTAVSGTFDAATDAAVRDWQVAGSVPATGVVQLGDVVFLPSPVSVAGERVAVGSGVTPGEPLLDLSSRDLVVTTSLDPGVATHVHAGDAVGLRLPDGSQFDGRFTVVGSTPTAAGPGAGSGGQGGTGAAGSYGVAAVARADDPTRLAGLAGTSITVEVTIATVADVLAVPVDALLVLADGGAAVEVESGSTSRFVRIQPGVYDRTLVEVQGEGLAAGDLVVVPAP
ncbi:MAG: peptidoglycan-binding protein [Candidatus Limnocylindrales bacterium]